MPVSIPKRTEHKPLAKCRALYLGSAVPLDTVQGLEAVQKPLRERYPLLDGTLPRDKALQGIDSWVTVFSTGIQLQYVTDGNAFWFPIQNLYVSVAVKCITQTNGATGDVIGRFVPLDSMGARVNNGHPPLFACILRRTKGVKVLECHGFVCKSEQASFALVQACQYAYEHKENWDEQGNPPPAETLEMGFAPSNGNISPAVQLVPAPATQTGGAVPKLDLSEQPPPKGYFLVKGEPNVMEFKVSQNGRGPTVHRGPTLMRPPQASVRMARFPPPQWLGRMPRHPPPRMMGPPMRPYYGPPPRAMRPMRPYYHHPPPPLGPMVIRGPPPGMRPISRYAESDPGMFQPDGANQEYLISRVGAPGNGEEGSSRSGRQSNRSDRRGSAGSSSSGSPKRQPTPNPKQNGGTDSVRRPRSSSSSSDRSIPMRERQQKSDRPPTPPADYPTYDTTDKRMSRRERFEMLRSREVPYQSSYPVRGGPRYYSRRNPRAMVYNEYDPEMEYEYQQYVRMAARARSVPGHARRSSRSNSRNRRGKSHKKGKGKSKKSSRARSLDKFERDEIINPEDIYMRDPERVPDLPRDWTSKQFMNERAFSHSVPRIHDEAHQYPTAYSINQEFAERSELDRGDHNRHPDGEITPNPLYDTHFPRPTDVNGEGRDLENTLGYLP